MKFKNKIKAANAVIKARFFGKKIPLAIRWQLTNRCISRCKYCNVWNTPSTEMTTEQIFSVLDELEKMGTVRISFSGGEPMLRNDIGRILDYAKEKGISPSMNSTGFLIKKRLNELRSLDLLKLSLDGPEKIHDFVRGKGAYKICMEAARVAKENNMNFTFATTLTKYNINHIDFLLKKAEEFDTLVAFQPLKTLYRGITNMESISPSIEDFRKAIKILISERERGNKHIRNTLKGLHHIENWPRYSELKCGAGLIFCMIDTNGDVIPCDRIKYKTKPLNCVEVGFKKAFENMPEPHCSGCGFCGALELNYLMQFNLGTLLNIGKLIQ
jgi:MoaA/NifB/PqqE/SkfB family radical SAM enzyme